MKRAFLLLALSAFALAQHDHMNMKMDTAMHEHHDGEAMTHNIDPRAVLTQRVDEKAHVVIYKIGPLRLPAHSDHMAVRQAKEVLVTMPFDGWITAYHPRLVNSAGARLPSRMLHHVAFWNVDRPDFLCPNKEEHIFGAGGEMNDWPQLPGLGYHVKRGDRIRVDTMFHNPTDKSYARVFLQVTMEYVPEGGGVTLKSVYPAWFDVRECGNSGYDLQPGANAMTGTHTLQYSGLLLGVGGHMHDFGKQLVLKDEAYDKPIATLDAKQDADGHLLSMPIVTFVERPEHGYPLTAGDKITVTSVYDNPTGQELPEGAMGIVVGYFLPADDRPLQALQRATAGR
jgi:hypothetical protein